MTEGTRYSMILITVNEGYSDDVLDTAKNAGARGGHHYPGPPPRPGCSHAVLGHLPAGGAGDFAYYRAPGTEKNRSCRQSAAPTASPHPPRGW